MKSIYPFLLTVLVVLTGILMYWADYLSLSSYFAITIVFLLLMAIFCKQTTTSVAFTHKIALMTYMGVALLSLMVFSNYYQAKGDIYFNTDHHALAWKGYQIPEKGLLYGPENNAFLQDTAITGSIRYELERNDSGDVARIHLTATGMGRSFFVGKKEMQDGVSEMFYNKNTTLSAIGQGGICFQNKVDSTILKFEVIEQPFSPGWILGGPERDSVLYVFTVTDFNNQTLCSDTIHSGLLIQKSYAISALMPVNTISNFGNNMEAYSIVREHYRTKEGPFTLNNYGWLKRMIISKKHESFRNQQYLVEQVQDCDGISVMGNNDEDHCFMVTLMPGDPFFVGFGSSGTPRMYFSKSGQLLFDLPQWRPLSSEKTQTDMLVSSSDFVVSNPKDISPYNILFNAPQIDKNDSDHGVSGNNHLFSTYVSYTKGPTKDFLRLAVNHQEIVDAGKDFLVACDAVSEAQAILQLMDFKSKSVFQPKDFHITILWIFILAALSVFFNIKRTRHEVMTIVTEMSCIVLLLVLFTTRYTMCWRMAVFPPFEDLSRHEFVSFVNNKTIHTYLTQYLLWGLAVLPLTKITLFIIRWIVAIKQSNIEQGYETFRTKKLQNNLCRRLLLWLPLFMAFIIEPICCMLMPRGAQILLPVSAYFLLDILLTYILLEKHASDVEMAIQNLRYYVQFPFVLNFVVHLILLSILDAGYGVMFLLYGIIRYYLSLARWALREERRKIIWWLGVLGIMTTILCLFYFSANIVAEMMNNPILGNTIFIIVGALGILLFAWGISETFDSKIFSKPIHSLGVVIVCLILSWCFVSATHVYDYVLGPDGHYTHLRYRTKVLVEDWADILNHERVSNARNISRFRQTSENQWILDHYYQNRPQAEEPYFKMQPMSKRGAMWGAQTTDLSFLRFGIGEHGMSFATGIILLMLLVCTIAMWQPKSPILLRKEARHNIAIGALLLILMQSVFVWMSVTNKFIFFGQDFPMLSMTSKMTIFYVLFLLILASLASVTDSEDLPKKFNKNEQLLSIIFSILLAIFCIFLHVWQGEDRRNKNLESYDLELNGVKNVLHVHNSLLRYYQIQANNAYNRIILKKEGYNRYGKKLLADFNDNIYLNLDEEHEGIQSPDCVIDFGIEGGTTKFPLVSNSSHLYQPLMDLYRLRRNSGSARIVMSPDSVTLQLVFPQDSLYTPQERSLIRELNYLFASFQIENQSMRQALLYVNRGGKDMRDAAKEERNAIMENYRRLNSSDFTAMMTDYQSFLKDARQHKGKPENVMLDSLLSRIDHLDSTEGTTFTNSLIEAYINNYAKNNSPENIIYIRRDRDTGFLQFNINRSYFKIEDIKSSWQGDIVANDAEMNQLLLVGNDRREIYGDQIHNDHFDIAKIPSSWLQGEKDQYLFKSYSPITVQLKAFNRVGLPHNQDRWSALKLTESDGAEIIETKGNVSVRLPNGLHHVFAKNIWINGKHRHVYPLGKELFWMKPYSDYVSAIMADSIESTKDENPQTIILPHVISLDYELSDSLYQKIAYIGDSIYNDDKQKEEWRQANLSVFVGNSNGEIVAIPEYNGNPFFRINPNDHASIAKVRNHSTLFSDYSDERNLNGNLNLLPLSIGPGSSLKPLTFGAVSSTFDPGWNTFRLVGSITHEPQRPYAVLSYAEKAFNRGEKPFTSLSGDEPEFGATFDIASYLIRSSNYFNSVVTFIGSFSEASLQKGIFTRSRDINQYGRDEFPVMSVSGKNVKFDTIFSPRGVDAEPILMKRFYDNYGVFSKPTIVDEAYLDQWSLDPVLRASSKNTYYKKRNRPWLATSEAWTIPEPSFIDFPLRADDAELSYIQKIKTITLGMRRIVTVTPLKMGEMFGRLFLLDNNFRFTISRPSLYQSIVNFNLPAYNNQADDYLKMLQADRSFYQGMRGCAMSGGTAAYMEQLSKELEGEGKYLYAKTGTIDNNKNNQANLLAVIITNADMQKVTIEDGKMVTPGGNPLKYYVIYIAQDKTLNGSRSRILKQKYQKDVVRTVIHSRRFKDFFSDNNN